MVKQMKENSEYGFFFDISKNDRWKKLHGILDKMEQDNKECIENGDKERQEYITNSIFNFVGLDYDTIFNTK